MSGPLTGKVALVAGATRGAGRGIAVALGEAGATVYCTGRSTRDRRSEYDRPETIEETAELVEAHFALALLIRRPGGLVVEMTDGTREYNATNCRLSTFYDLAKTSVVRLAFTQGHELAPHGCTAVALSPGWMRTEMMLEIYGVSEDNWREATTGSPHFKVISETPRFVGRAVAALAADPAVHARNGGSFSAGALAQEYGFTDLDGSQPDCWRYMVEVQDPGLAPDATGYR